MPLPTPDPTEKHPSVRASLLFLVPLSIVFVGVISTFYINYSTAYVDGASMEPTLVSGELVLVTRDYERPARGDVVVVDLSVPGEEPDILVKRIVGLPGDEIEVEEGNAFVNGEPEKGQHTVYISCCDLSVPLQVVPEDRVFLLGDNRPISEDSRVFGTVLLEDVRGEVVAVVAPVGDARFVD